MKKKNKLITSISVLMLSTSVLFAGSANAQIDEYGASLLGTKRTFSQGYADAIGQPFRGVVTSSGITQGLFPIKATGVSTDTIRAAAIEFLSSLTTGQLSRTHFAINDPEWRNWSNVDTGIFARYGVSLEEMSEQQKEAAWNLMATSLSAKGLQLTRNIMKTEQTLLELNDDVLRYGEEKYHLTMMGVPSPTEPWGWQLDGHHLVINYFVLGDQVVMTPTFLGAEPAVARSGMYEGNAVFQDYQDIGLAFMRTLDSDQRGLATIEPDKTRNNMVAAANEDNLVLDYVGIAGSEFTTAQKQGLLELIGLYVGNMREDHAAVRMADVEQHINDTHFAWVGGTDDDAVFYYRIHSPVVLIEFDHQGPVGTLMNNPAGTPHRQHIHIVVRTPNGNDYGKDLLRQHLANQPH